MRIITEFLHENWKVFLALNHHAGHERVIDPLMILSANDLIALMPLILLVLWFALARWSPLFGRTPSGNVDSWREHARSAGQRLALLGCAAVALALGLNLIVGHFIYEPRPFVSHPSTVHQLIPHVSDASFPSDHEAAAGAVTTVILLYLGILLISALWNKRGFTPVSPESRSSFLRLAALAGALAIIAVLAAGAIGVARIYTGLHYPGDVLAGAVIGALGGFSAVALWPLTEPIMARVIRVAEHLRLA